MRLLIIRHGIAEEREDYQERSRSEAEKRGEEPRSVDDDFRPLTDQGLRKMMKISRALPDFVERPNLLLSSPLVRALQTAEVLRGAWSTKKLNAKLDLHIVEWLRPDSSPDQLVRGLGGPDPEVQDDSLVAIVGHEPHLSHLISWLSSGSKRSHVQLKKGGACLLEFRERPARAEGRLLWLVPPRILANSTPLKR